MLRAERSNLRDLGVRGLVAALEARYRGAPVLLELTRRDLAHPLSLRVPTADRATYKQIFKRGEYDFATQRPPRVIVDAGAHIGLASVLFANRYPEARIIAVEPQSGNFELLRRNVAPYPQISPLRAAVWHESTSIELHDPGLGTWGYIARARSGADDAQAGGVEQVPAVTIDAIMRDCALDHIDILKVDIEGAEREVFGHCAAWIDRVTAIIVELHERLKPGCELSFAAAAAGFQTRWEQGENVYVARDGYLIQRRP